MHVAYEAIDGLHAQAFFQVFLILDELQNLFLGLFVIFTFLLLSGFLWAFDRRLLWVEVLEHLQLLLFRNSLFLIQCCLDAIFELYKLFLVADRIIEHLPLGLVFVGLIPITVIRLDERLAKPCLYCEKLCKCLDVFVGRLWRSKPIVDGAQDIADSFLCLLWVLVFNAEEFEFVLQSLRRCHVRPLHVGKLSAKIWLLGEPPLVIPGYFGRGHLWGGVGCLVFETSSPEWGGRFDFEDRAPGACSWIGSCLGLGTRLSEFFFSLFPYSRGFRLLIDFFERCWGLFFFV